MFSYSPRHVLISCKIRPVVISSHLWSSTKRNVVQLDTPSNLDKEVARVMMHLETRRVRRMVTSTYTALLFNIYNMIRYRLFYDRRFSMRQFLRFSNDNVHKIAKKLMEREAAGLKDMFVPSALKYSKQLLVDDDDVRRLLPVVASSSKVPVIRKKVFSTRFSYYPGSYPRQSVFEITVLYIFPLNPRFKIKPKIVGVPNRFGGIDQTVATLPEDTHFGLVLWLTWIRRLEGSAKDDWRVSRYEPTLSSIPGRYLEEI